MFQDLQPSDIIGPVVSVVAATASAVCFWLNFKLSKRMADRSLNLEAQKMLLELDRQLMSDPWLWSMYDDHPIRLSPDYERLCARSPVFQAKLEAFAYLKLNMFEIVLVEAPEPTATGTRNYSNVWLDYFHHTVARSSVIRAIFERPDASQLYNPLLIELYRQWKDANVAAAASGH
jgi:hypothetical protein